MESVATVLAVAGERARVCVDTPAACARCAAGRGCGALVFSRRGPVEIDARVAPGLVLRPGDRVRLELESDRLLAVAGLAYGLPLAGLVAGTIAAGAWAPGSELASVAGALTGLLAGALGGRRGLARRATQAACVPTAAARLR